MKRNLLFVALLCPLFTQTRCQSVIINEVSQGAGGGQEWVELLVISQGADLRGWSLGDNDDGIWHGIAGFTTSDLWSDLSSGTLIVIYNSGDVDATLIAAGAPDLDASDKRLLIPINEAALVLDDGPWGLTAGAFANSDRDDCPALKDASGTIIHDMAVSHPIPIIEAPAGGEVASFMGNQTSQLSDPERWQITSSETATPGAGNGGANSSWMDASLPVDLELWQGHFQEDQIILEWRTASEHENLGFIIERKTDAAEWTEIATYAAEPALAGQGSTTAPTIYRYADSRIERDQVYHYRLWDMSYQAHRTEHGVIMVSTGPRGASGTNALMSLEGLYPNPFNTELKLIMNLRAATALELHIRNLQGKLVYASDPQWRTAGLHTLTWDGLALNGNALSSGLYVLEVISQGGRIQKSVTLIR